MDMVLYALLRKYVQDSIAGAGSIKGAPCEILSIERNQEDNANVVTFKWEDKTGASQTSTMTVPDGAVGPQGPKGDKGATGPQGNPGIGVPAGGSAGQVLVKNSGADYDAKWGNGGSGSSEFLGTQAKWDALTTEQKNAYDIVNITDDEQVYSAGIPSGGTTGQVLAKKSNSDYDTEWADDIEGINTNPSIALRPTVFFSFDEVFENPSDTRFAILEENGFRGVFSIRSSSTATNWSTWRNLIDAGHEWNLYSGDVGQTKPANDASFDTWYNYIKPAIDYAANHGMYCPVFYSASGHQCTGNQRAAAEKCGIKYIRAGVIDPNNTLNPDSSWQYLSKSSFNNQFKTYIRPILLNAGVDSAKTNVDDAIAGGYSICFFMHTYNTDNFTEAQFREVVEYVKAKVDAGVLDCLTPKQYYDKYRHEYDFRHNSGDMFKSTYDPNGVVEDAGGIEGYVEEECVNKSEFTIIAPNNLFDINTSKPNFRPSTSAGSVYGDGTAQNGINTTNLMPCSASEKFKTNLTSVPSYVRSSYYDANKVFVGNLTTFTVDSDGYVYFQAGTWTNVAYVCIWGTFSTDEWNNLVVDDYDNFTEYKKVIVNDLYLSDDNAVMAKDRLGLSDSDILKGKKWAVIGDSFTAGDFGGVTPPTIPSGKYAGMLATYPYLIATRCGMDIQSLFQNGRTLAYAADGTVTNSVMSVYQNIDADADYLTIYIGINDSHHRTGDTGVIPLGTITDSETSTFYGAWNTLLTWIITNRPNLHIGIIVSNGCETDDYRTATIAIAEKYGIPYIDMNGDRHTPCMMRSTNEAIDSSIRAQRTNAWRVSSTNGHPNADCHVFEATFIENFLRTL